MFNYRSKFATTPSSFRLLRRSQVAKLYEDIERNVADAGVYQHLNHIATDRLFFPQENYRYLQISVESAKRPAF